MSDASDRPEPRSESARLGDLEVAYSVWARFASQETTPVVFVHGWSCSQSVWNAQVTGDLPGELRARRRITIDLPGHGRSTAPADNELTVDLFAGAVAAVLDREKVTKAVLVGHSNGAPVIRQFYRRHPERTAALVIVDGPLRSFFADAAQAASFVERLRDEVFTRSMVEQIVGEAAPAAQRERIVTMMMATPAPVRVSAFRATLDSALWTDDSIRAPLLMVNAKQPAWSADYVAYVRSLAPQVEYHEWTGVTHFLMLDEPTRFNELLARFMGAHRL
jgi:pimeloyl-ACP methyl ester carboxylesterase